MRKNNYHIPKSLLVINNFIIVIACIAFIIGFIFFVNYLIEVDGKYSASSFSPIFEKSTFIVPTNLECQISDGTYKTIYDTEFSYYPNFKFEIDKDSIYFEYEKNGLKIERLPSMGFLVHHHEMNMDSLTKFQKKIIDDFKYSYYQIEECKGDTLKFRLGPNLHITSATGIFVKIN